MKIILSRYLIYFLQLNLIVSVIFNWDFSNAATPSCQDLFSISSSRYDFSKPPKANKVEFTNPPILRLTNYTMINGSFNNGFVSERTFDGESFENVDSYLTTLGNPTSSGDMLAEQQDFSLNKMVETGYITTTEAEYFRKLGLNLNPNQVHFWEVYHEATGEELRQNYNDPRFRIISSGHTNHSNQHWAVKTAAMWNVAGQVWDIDKGYKPLKLPWELEEARKDFALDRSKYKFVFEWGRAAQDLPGDIEHVYAANTLLSLVQVLAYGGRVEDAYVMVHSFNKVNTRLYSRMHPNTLYPPEWKNLEDALFLVPLKEALEKYPISRASKRVHQVLEITKGQLTPVQAVTLIAKETLFRRMEMHFHSSAGDQKAPVIITDASAWKAYASHAVARIEGLTPETAQKLYAYFMTLPTLEPSYNYLDKYKNGADSAMSIYDYAERNAIEISNLDPDLAAQDPFFVLRALFSTLHHKTATLALTVPHLDRRSYDDAYREALEILEKHNVQIGITAHSPVILQQIRDLQPSETVPLLGTLAEEGVPQSVIDAFSPNIFRDSEMNFFTVKQIVGWAKENPWRYHSLSTELSFGPWTSQYLLSLPDAL